jgi:hypothetical protein
MTFRVQAGAMEITGPSGNRIFHTDDGLFHTISALSGTQAIATFSGGNNTTTDTTKSYLLGSCNTNCTDVAGSVKFTLNNYAAGMAFDRWNSIFGGSVLWVLDGHSLTGSPGNSYIGQVVAYSFRVTAGQVFLDRRIYISNQTGGTYTILSHTINYKLKCGLFV